MDTNADIKTLQAAVEHDRKRNIWKALAAIAVVGVVLAATFGSMVATDDQYIEDDVAAETASG